MPKPSDFFIGIVDLFAILIPGSVLAFAIYKYYGIQVTKILPDTEIGTQITFILVSYFLGHLVFLIGSRLDKLYDFHLKLKKNDSIHIALRTVREIQKKYMDESFIKVFDTYKWGTAYLTTHYPDAMHDINSLVADSKFFRSLFIVIPVISYIVYAEGTILQAILTLLLLVPCYIRYFERRLKSKMRVYQYLVTLDTMGKLPEPKI